MKNWEKYKANAQKCSVCDKLFRPYIYSIKKGFGKFCSLQCYWQSLRGREGYWKGKKRSPETIKKMLASPRCVKARERKLERVRHSRFKKGHIPWSKGLTKETNETIARLAEQNSVNNKLKGYAPTREAQIKGFKARFRRPTRPEKRFIAFCRQYNLPFKYIGKGDVWIGKRNPDFIDCNGRKVVVEILGNYWHKPEDAFSMKKDYAQYGFECITIWENETKDESRLLGLFLREE